MEWFHSLLALGALQEVAMRQVGLLPAWLDQDAPSDLTNRASFPSRLPP